MSVLLENNIILFIGIVLLAWGGYRLKALSRSGAWGTFFVGILIAINFHGYGLLLIGVFFITSSYWSKFNRKKKDKVEDMHEKGSRRDYVQVLANGGVPVLISVLAFLFPMEAWLYGFVAAVAAANSDTWASEIGTLSKGDPVSVFSLKRVKRGTSGAISVLGTMAALAGSVLISFAAMLLWDELTLGTALILTAIGFIGCFVDTVLGATVQAVYRCSVCGGQVEKEVHCEKQTILIKGSRRINNDAVNISSIVFASSIAIFVALVCL